MPITQKLQLLATEISQCRKCDEDGIAVIHSKPMVRGTGKNIMVIGIQPGKTEVTTARAFSGPAGKRLMEWLRSCGIGVDEDEIFKNVYFTSLVKCHNLKSGTLWKSIYNCLPYLEEQIRLIQPSLCITLGKEPLEALFKYEKSLDGVVGRGWLEHELNDMPNSLIPMRWLPLGCKIFPLPHPSPLSRWLNSKKNVVKLEQALKELEGEV